MGIKEIGFTLQKQEVDDILSKLWLFLKGVAFFCTASQTLLQFKNSSLCLKGMTDKPFKVTDWLANVVVSNYTQEIKSLLAN